MGGCISFLFGVLAVRSMVSRTEYISARDTASVCSQCRYDLGGLDAEATCPECGAKAHERVRIDRVVRRGIEGGVFDVLVATCFVFVLRPIPFYATYSACRLHGFSALQSRGAASVDSQMSLAAWVAVFFLCAAVARLSRRVRPMWRTSLVAAAGLIGSEIYFIVCCRGAMESPFNRSTDEFTLMASILAIACWGLVCVIAQERDQMRFRRSRRAFDGEPTGAR